MSEETPGRDRPGEEGVAGPNPFSRQGAEAWSFGDPGPGPGPGGGNASPHPDEPPAAPASPPPAAPPHPPPTFPPAAYPPAGSGPVLYGSYGGDHPHASAALVTGIIGLVLGLAFGLGGLVGIVGVVLGHRTKRAIDGDPARWTGRGKAQAGFVLGIMGLVALVLWVLLFLTVAVFSA